MEIYKEMVINLVIEGSNFVFNFSRWWSECAIPNMHFSERGYIYTSISVYVYDDSVA